MTVKRQQGAVLIVSLLMLLLVTLLGVAAMNNSLLGLKITGNYQRQMQALNTAETAMRLAEAEINDAIGNAGPLNLDAEDHFYDSRETLDTQTHLNACRSASCAGGETYIIEYLGDKTLPGESIAVNPDGAQPGSAVHAYLITAEGETGQGANRRIQAPYTTYKRP